MSYAALLDRMGQVNDLLNAGSVLSWDARVTMPRSGAQTRAKQIATVSTLARDILVADETRRLLDAAEAEVQGRPDDSVERTVCGQVRAALDYHDRIPGELIRRKAEMGAIGQEIWAEARAADDFAAFAPLLADTVALNRQMAEHIGYEGHPYDALMARFEPGETVASLGPLFRRLRGALRPLLQAVQARPGPDVAFLRRPYPAAAQLAFGLKLAEGLGYDLDRGRLDTTVHPFEVSFTRNDVRITTRINERWMPMCLFGCLHEAGHALYEQNCDPAYTRTPLATDLVGLYAVAGVSFGAHESQSRLWENHVGRSRAFWEANFPAAREAFPEQLADVDVEAFWRGVNRVEPGLIRVEADELSYDLHIMLRVDIEAALIDGSLAVADLPEAWNARIREDLGLEVPNNRLGVLQDVHWAAGQIGTFCNYTIGNVMAAQLYEGAAAGAQMQEALGRGDYAPLLGWMTEHVHRHGRRYGRDELLRRATGRTLDPEPYIAHLTRKYTDIYGVQA